MSPTIKDQLIKEIDRMLVLGVVEECPANEWNNQVSLVRKNFERKIIFLDARNMNSKSLKDSYPLPIIDGLLSRLKDSYHISAIDLKDAY